MPNASDWSVYIVRCRDGSLYTGVAKDAKARVAAHNAGRGAAYTRARRPVRIVHREDGFSRGGALSREAAIKSLERVDKLALIRKAARRAAAAALLAFAAGRAAAAPTFAPEPAVAVASAAPQAFVGSYPNLRMYFVRQSSGVEVGSALSPDGIAWIEDPAAGRLSTATLPSVSASSITGCGVLDLNGGGFRMEYSIKSTTGAYRIHSATSADGLAWANDAGVRIDNGLQYLGSPKIVKLNDASWRMYWVGANGPGIGNRQVFSARSTDQGLTWSAPSVVLSTLAFEVGASVLTNGFVRLYYTEPLAGQSSATVVLSALSRDTGGTLFSLETGNRISTSAASGTLSSPVPVRSTDTFRWRLYYDFADPNTVSTADVHTELTAAPAPASISPASANNVAANAGVTILGEIFSTPAPTVSIKQGGTTVPGTSVTRTDDQTLSATFAVNNLTPGLWDLVVTNADGTSATLVGAYTITFPGGSVALTNNLLRPRLGQPTTIAITTFNDGPLLARVLTLDGNFVRTLFDGQEPKGVLNLTWDGRDSTGASVASGLYILRVIGQKTDVKQKIVVIR